MNQKEKAEIKRAILNSVSNTVGFNPALLAITTCEAFNYINCFGSEKESSSEEINLGSDSEERINQYIKKLDKDFNETDSQTLKNIEALKEIDETIDRFKTLKGLMKHNILSGQD